MMMKTPRPLQAVTAGRQNVILAREQATLLQDMAQRGGISVSCVSGKVCCNFARTLVASASCVYTIATPSSL